MSLVCSPELPEQFVLLRQSSPFWLHLPGRSNVLPPPTTCRRPWIIRWGCLAVALSTGFIRLTAGFRSMAAGPATSDCRVAIGSRSESRRRKLMRNLRVYFALSLLSGCLLGQNAPPPDLREEARSPVIILAGKACDVEVTGEIEAGQTTSGPGTLSMRNTGERPVAAIRGSLEYRTDRRTLTIPWNQSLFSISRRGAAYIRPNRSAAIPAQPTNIGQSGERLASIAAQVHGVLYGDGTTCGAQGDRVKDEYLRNVSQQRSYVDLAIRSCETQTQPEIERDLRKGMLNFPEGGALNSLLQRHLLDENGRLKADPVQTLRAWRANLENPFELGEPASANRASR